MKHLHAIIPWYLRLFPLRGGELGPDYTASQNQLK